MTAGSIRRRHSTTNNQRPSTAPHCRRRRRSKYHTRIHEKRKKQSKIFFSFVPIPPPLLRMPLLPPVATMQLHLSATNNTNDDNTSTGINHVSLKYRQIEPLILRGTSVPKEWWIHAAEKGDPHALYILEKQEEERQEEDRREERRKRETRQGNKKPACGKTTKEQLAAFRRAKIVERAEQNTIQKKRMTVDFPTARSCFGLYRNF